MKNPKIIQQIKADQLDKIIAEGKFNIIDVRTPAGIEQQGRIPGAINIPHNTIETAIDENHEHFNPIFKSSYPFLFACTGGVMSYAAALKAQAKGVEGIYNLEGGHAAWASASKKPACN